MSLVMSGELTVSELFCAVAGDAFWLSDVMWPAVSVCERRSGAFLISTATHSQLGRDYISFSFAGCKRGKVGRNTSAASETAPKSYTRAIHAQPLL